jgi:hypothetical protein
MDPAGSADPYHWITDPDPLPFPAVAFKVLTKSKFFYNTFYYYLCTIGTITLILKL